MDTKKGIAITLMAIFTIAITFLIVRLLLRKMKPMSETNGHLKISYGIWFSLILISISIVAWQVIDLSIEAFDNIVKIKPSKIWSEFAKTFSIYIGLGILWFLVIFYMVKFMTSLFIGKRNGQLEMEADNFSFFLIRGSLLVSSIVCLCPILNFILRQFMPNISLPFYH